MELIMDGKDTPLGHMLAVWMAASQRAVVAAQSDWVVTVMPLPSMSFLENTKATRQTLPAVVCRTFDLAGAESGRETGVIMLSGGEKGSARGLPTRAKKPPSPNPLLLDLWGPCVSVSACHAPPSR